MQTDFEHNLDLILFYFTAFQLGDDAAALLNIRPYAYC
jgi:hypothetical protein